MAMMLCAIVPMGFVLYYSVHDTFGGNSFIWVGADWYRNVITSREFVGALQRSLLFSIVVLLLEIPLGLYIALKMPPSGAASTILIMVMAIPLLAPLWWLVISGMPWFFLMPACFLDLF